jgi:hypothetical protein
MVDGVSVEAIRHQDGQVGTKLVFGLEYRDEIASRLSALIECRVDTEQSSELKVCLARIAMLSGVSACIDMALSDAHELATKIGATPSQIDAAFGEV